MKKAGKYISFVVVFLTLLTIVWSTSAKVSPIAFDSFPASPPADTPVTLPFPFEDESDKDPLNYPNSGGLKLDDPSNVKKTVEYDPSTGNYNINQKIGSFDYRPPTYMDQEEYSDYELNKAVKNYWKQRANTESASKQNQSVFAPKLHVGGEVFDRIFGGNTIDIRPQGTAELTFGANTSKTENPAIPEKQRKTTTFDFNEKIQLNVVGKIGDKLKITTNYNTEAQFDFENQMKLEYTGHEDEIIKKIEAGNVSLPLTGSLITGSQSLFGIKTQLQFGRLTATSIFSQQKGKKSEVEVSGGAQTSNFEINADSYEANKNYFLSQYFRNHYDEALATLPTISSGINITKIEVWVTNKTNTQENIRNILAFTDLGDTSRPTTPYSPDFFVKNQSELPDNSVNSLDPTVFSAMHPGVRSITQVMGIMQGLGWDEKHFVRLDQARKLSPTEFTFNPRLGFISLNQTLNDDILAVAFQYTYNNQVFQVGEFSTDITATDSLLFVKLLKSPVVSPRTQTPMWDLMMKNVYSIGAYQVNPQDFKLDVIYANPATGTDLNYLPVAASETNITGKPLIQVLNLDKLNVPGDAKPDGVFDFIEGVTILPANGRVYFTTLEPFGSSLRSRFIDQTAANNFVFQQLYDSSKTAAQQFPDKNRFKLKGTYKSSSSSEISLNAINIPQGSVSVTANGAPLTENVDYTVDYTIGRVKIINLGILSSGAPIKISLESNSLFNIQTKTLLGTHLDYRVSKDFNIGGTVLNLTERPITPKINIGDEPISNTIWGLDANYRTEAPFLTRWLDKLPLLETKEPSSITFNGEFAQLVPGHARAIGKDGNSYIDDFEGSQSTIDIKSPYAWTMASTPQGQPSKFPEGNLTNNLDYGKKRALLAWYQIDPLFQRQTSGLTPSYYTATDMSSHLSREIPETEIFPNKESPSGQIPPLPTLDLAFYPNERGPYNYDTLLNANGTLQNPETRWGGIMRKIETNDFEAANIDFIQFWLMDPFNTDNPFGSTSGDLYFNLGNISEDVLRDSRKSYENGLPNSSTVANVETTSWGRVPLIQPVNKAFDVTGREYQDVGLDGLGNSDEINFFQSFISSAPSIVSSDPSADDYHYYRGDDYDNQNLKTLERYKRYNGTEGNSPTQEQSEALNSGKYPTSSTINPNEEDINRDNTLNEIESYYQYRISLKPNDLVEVGKNFITDKVERPVAAPDQSQKSITWYQFKIPIKEFEARIGNIEDFRSIRFIRMFLKGLDTAIVLRFARLELVRSEWRKYDYSLLAGGEYGDPDDSQTAFNVSAVNIEENGNRNPVNYVLPPDIERETSVQSVSQVQLNEQAMSLRICNLKDGDSRAVYKNTDMDVRSYKKLKMFVHAEAGATDALKNNELSMFIRLGTDYTGNYYEYEIPLTVTPAKNYTATNVDDQRIVWPDENRLELAFEVLQSAKQSRNIALANTPGMTLQTPYTTNDPNSPGGKNRITIVGNPNLSSVKTIMIGIRNPKQGSSGDGIDDAQAKCGEIWVNELRLSDFDEKGGWAANTRVTAKLADFGTLTMAGSMSTPGFGSLEKKVSERSRETIKQYDISSSLEMGKLLPEQLNIKVPMYVGYSEGIRTPQYNPLDPDILLKTVLPTLSKEDRDSIKRVTEDYTLRKSLNFTNVRKEKGSGSKKSHVYDVENLSATYAYSEIFMRNVNIEYNVLKTYRGGLAYNYTANPKNIKPFDKLEFLKSKHFSLIKDFNFYLIPKKYGFTTDINRSYNEVKNRNITAGSLELPPTFNKTFTMSRLYNLSYDLTKSLKIDFTATNDARIMEPDGRLDTREKRDSVKENILALGTNTSYRHNTGINYTIPINKVPLLDFTTANVRYSSGYVWTRAPFAADSLGNTIQNNNSVQWNGQLNMVTLYNKIPYLKKVIQNKPAPKPVSNISKNKKPLEAASDTTKDKNKKKKNFLAVDHLARLIMSVRNISISYTDNAGIILPGYKDSTRILGINPNSNAPGVGFVFGSQKDIRPEARTNGWLVQNEFLNIPYAKTNTKTLNLRANLEPFPNCRIELTGNRTISENYNEFFRWDPTIDDFIHASPTLSGNFSISYLTWRTAFRKQDEFHSSSTFNDFLNYRIQVSEIHRKEYEDATSTQLGYTSNGYADGFGRLSQDVLIPSFLAAYSGKSPDKSHLNLFPEIPLPNWRITYDGLSKLAMIKKYFKTFTLSHAYRSTYAISSYSNNLNFIDIGKGYTNVKTSDNNFIPENLITTVTISEQFSPLIKVDGTWNNSFITNLEIKKDRILSLSIVGAKLTEINGREIVVGSGYRIKDVVLGKFKIKGKPIQSDLTLKADVSIRNNKTIIRDVDNGISQARDGQNVISIRFSADYMISSNLTIRAFFDKTITNPIVPSTFPSSYANSGVSIRFNLAQ